MKKIKTITTAIFAFAALQLHAQTSAPEGYTTGSITLTGGAVKTGYVKNNMHKKATISFMESEGSKAVTYDGWQLAAVTAGTINYTCIKGDFFTVLTAGQLTFLQKQSAAAGKIDYIGSEPVLRPAAEGKKGDYFVFNSSTGELSLVTKNSYDQVTTALFGSYEPALNKAKETRNDVADLKQAVEIYNQRPAR